jgi:hypothetical protein
VRGEVKGAAGGFAGIDLIAAKNFSGTVDLSSKKELVFWARGDGRTYAILLFTPATMRSPATTTFTPATDWQEVRVPLDRFQGTDRKDVAFFFFGATDAGTFQFQLDDVRIR